MAENTLPDDLIEKHVNGGKFGMVPVVKLDGFTGAGATSFEAGQAVPSRSARTINEDETDDYLIRFAGLFAKILPVFGKRVKAAMNSILTKRNGRRDRDRIAGMNEMVKIVPNILGLKAIADHGIGWGDLWTHKAVKYTVAEGHAGEPGEVYEDQLMVHVEADNFFVGGGDGEARAWNEDEPLATENALRAKLQDALDMDKELRARKPRRRKGRS